MKSPNKPGLVGPCPRAKPEYGLDAPHVVRNLAIVAVVGAAIAIASFARLLPAVFVLPIGPLRFEFPLVSLGSTGAVACGAMAGWMFYSSRIGKIHERERLLNALTWTGAERVLDVGCGRGLMLVGAARRLTSGHATGIDIWQAEDLSGNRPEATERNLEIEGVADRADIRTANMRGLPFPDATFDVVVSRAAIHNLYTRDDRATAIREIARVLEPGGHALIEDIRHHREYAATFAASGCTVVRWIGSPLVRVGLAIVTMGSLSPATLLVVKTKE